MSWISKKFTAVALDPVHIGTGGERLGRVDLSVVREPVTNVPKIPGTTLSGAMKFFLDLSLRDKQIKTDICASTKGSSLQHTWARCPVCLAFGYTPQRDKNGTSTHSRSAQGVLQFTDATLLAYPVPTITGPVWISTKPRLKDILGIGDGLDDPDECWLMPEGSEVNPLTADRLNFGWTLLDKGSSDCPSVSAMTESGIDEKYGKKIVVVAEWIFAYLVNNNMEIRTSVVIDPTTGAATSQGLFTYEAVARGAFFGIEIIENDFMQGWQKVGWNDSAAPKPANTLDMIVEYALDGIKSVGLGGMTTRGFGRLEFTEISTCA
jgi:CRISPR-associated protein Cmr4